MGDFGPWVDVIQSGGVLTFALFIVWAFSTRKWHTHGELEEEQARTAAAVEDARWWRDLWLRTFGVSDRATKVAGGLVDPGLVDDGAPGVRDFEARLRALEARDDTRVTKRGGR